MSLKLNLFILIIFNSCQFLNGEISSSEMESSGSVEQSSSSSGGNSRTIVKTNTHSGTETEGSDEDLNPPFAGGGGNNLSVAGFDRRLQNYFEGQEMTISASVLYAQGNISYVWSNALNGVNGMCTNLNGVSGSSYKIVCPDAGSLTVTLVARDERGQTVSKSFTFTNLIKTTAINSATFNQARTVMQNKCMSCHDGTPQPAWNLSSEMAFVNQGRVSVGLGAEFSSLLVKIKGFGNAGNMPTDSNISEDEVATLVKWIEGL